MRQSLTQAPSDTVIDRPRRFGAGDVWETAHVEGGVPPLGGDDEYSVIGDIIAAIRKRYWLILTLTVLMVLPALLFTLLTDKVYVARATFEVQRETPKALDVNALETDQGGSDDAFMATQFALIKSRATAEGIVDRLRLDRNTTFLARNDLLTGAVSASAREGLRNAAIAKAASQITVAAVDKSSLIQITSQGNDPKLTAAIANAAVDEFIESSIRRKFDASLYARNFLERRLNEMKVRLENSERELVRYAETQHILSVSDGKSEAQSLDSAVLAALNQNLAQARADRLVAEANWSAAQGAGGRTLPQVMDNAELVALRTQLAQAQSEYSQKVKIFKPTFPDLVQLSSRIGQLRGQIAAVEGQILRSLRASYGLSVSKEKLLDAEMEKLKESVVGFQNRNIKYTILRREVDTNRALYDALLQRFKEIGVSGGSGANNVSVIDRARIPGTPSRPILWLNLTLAMLVGLALGLGLAVMLEFLDDTLKQPEDVERKLRLPLLGLAPKFPQGEFAITQIRDRRSALSEAYFSVQTALNLLSANELPRSLLVTSAGMGEGKSTTSIALAKSLADQGKKVLLVDADLRKPTIHNVLGISSKLGFSNVLAAEVPFAQAVNSASDLGFDVITVGPLPPNPALLLSTGLRPRLKEFEAGYDIVVLDGPPIIGLADAPLLADAVQGTIIVIEANKRRRTVIRRALHRLQQSRSPILGVVLTKFDAARANIGYSYEYMTSYYSYGSKIDASKDASS